MGKVAISIFALLISAQSSASAYIYQLTGSIFEIDSAINSVDLSDHWSATFTIPANAIADSSDPYRIKYYGAQGEIYIAGKKIMDIDVNAYVGYGYDTGVGGVPDYFEIVGDNSSGQASYLDGQLLTGFGLGIRDSFTTETSLDSTLQLNQLIDGSWGSGFYLYTNNNHDYYQGDRLVSGLIDTIDVRAVPIPATAWLFVSALATFAGIRFKR